MCLDIAARAYERECEFWRDLTGLELGTRRLRGVPDPGPAGRQPIRVLLQRVGDDRPRVTAHLDVYTKDREAETRRHEELGATVLRQHPHFTVLTDPTGAAYCITPRDAVTGMLDRPSAG